MPKSPPTLLGVADTILAELDQLDDWVRQLREDLAESDRRRVRLACALDAAIAALEPQDREAYERKLKAVAGAVGRAPVGRPHADERFETVMRLLANWTDELISTTDIRLEFQRRRFAGARNYASNILKRLEARGMVMRTGYGRYRIVRHHPHLVSRRTGLWDAHGGEAIARPRLRDL
jgi:hypothetical protein